MKCQKDNKWTAGLYVIIKALGQVCLLGCNIDSDITVK